MTEEVTEADLRHLRRCVELATEAVEAGDFPFGSVLVAADGTVLAEDRNREVTAGDPTRHPEFALARWAATNMTPPDRATATVYTSGEHCPMCSAAHGWAGLGRIVYATCTADSAPRSSAAACGPEHTWVCKVYSNWTTTGVEDAAVLVSARHPGQGDPAGAPALHGRARQRDDRGGAGLPRLLRVPARGRHPAHPAGRRGGEPRGVGQRLADTPRPGCERATSGRSPPCTAGSPTMRRCRATSGRLSLDPPTNCCRSFPD